MGCGKLSSVLVEAAELHVSPVCSVAFRPYVEPYLEIEPTVLWMLPELYTADNDVISNTNWNVE